MLSSVLRFYFIIGFFLSFSHYAIAQQHDELMKEDSIINVRSDIETFQSKSKIDPDKSVLFAAVVPGLGQIYNKQYWKLPLIYGGAIVMGHLIKYNDNIYNAMRNAYIAETDGLSETVNPYRFDQYRLELNAERFRRQRDYMIVMATVLYAIQIVDAHVAAHLTEFEINEDLALKPNVKYLPSTAFTQQQIGFSLALRIK